MAVGYLTPDARLRIVGDLSVIVPGAKLHTYVAGTPSTNQQTFSDSALTVPNANPVLASAFGLFGPIYLTPGLGYKLVLADAADVVIWTQDNVLVPAGGLTAPVSVIQGGTGLIVGVSGGLLFFSAPTVIASSALLAAHGVVVGGGAGVAPLTTAVGLAGQALLGAGAAADPLFGYGATTLDRSTTEQDVNTTVVETSVYAFAVPGGTLGTARALRFTFTGSWLDNAGGANTLIIKIKYGGTTIATFNLAAGAANANRMWLAAGLVLSANGAAGSQRSSATCDLGNPTSDGAPSGNTRYIANHGAVAVDSSVAQTFTATVTLGIANAALSVRRYAAILEVI